MIKIANSYSGPHIRYLSAEAIKVGQLVKENGSGKAAVVAEAHSGETLLGIALTAASAADQVISIQPLRGVLLEIDVYQGGATDTFTDANMATLWDLYVDGTSGEFFIDPNDSTGGFLRLMSYDNDIRKAWVTLAQANLYLAL